MVKILLDFDADVHQRTLGNFFRPNDQRKLFKKLHRLIETNYEGNFYLGEYPLSFAACLNQKDCVRILKAHGADLNKQDSNGNTALHMLVIHNNLTMIKFMIELRADFTIKNHFGLTPFLLSAKLAKKEIFHFLFNIKRNKLLVYADIACGAFPLEDFDSIKIDGHTNEKSALHLVVNGVI